MKSGLSNRVVGQAGEYAVCSQLGKMGLIATPFAGNVPGFDVQAVDEQLNCVPIQVKTSRSYTWITGDISNYVKVSIDADVMNLGEPKKPPYPDLIRIYVSLGSAGQHDRFFVITEENLYTLVVAEFRNWIQGHGGIRPKNPRSLHSAIEVQSLKPYENRWDLIDQRFKSLQKAKSQSEIDLSIAT